MTVDISLLRFVALRVGASEKSGGVSFGIILLSETVPVYVPFMFLDMLTS